MHDENSLQHLFLLTAFVRGIINSHTGFVNPMRIMALYDMAYSVRRVIDL